jgi:hypothetical protein
MSEKRRAAARAVGLVVLSGFGGFGSGAAPSAAATNHAVTDGLTTMPLYPFAGGPLDVLSNNLAVPFGGTQVSTLPVTAPFRRGLPLRDVPVAGSLLL